MVIGASFYTWTVERAGCFGLNELASLVGCSME